MKTQEEGEVVIWAGFSLTLSKCLPVSTVAGGRCLSSFEWVRGSLWLSVPLNVLFEFQCSSSQSCCCGPGGFNPLLTPLPGSPKKVQNSQGKAVLHCPMVCGGAIHIPILVQTGRLCKGRAFWEEGGRSGFVGCIPSLYVALLRPCWWREGSTRVVQGGSCGSRHAFGTG